MAATLLVALLLASCGPVVAALLRQSQGPGPLPIELAPEHERYREQIEQAAAESIMLYARWLDATLPALTIETRAPETTTSASDVALRLPWRASDSAMEIQAQVAYRLAKRYWIEADTEPAIARGLAWYLQTRVVEHIFNLRYALPAHSTDNVRFLGGHVPWAFPALRLNRWSTVTHTASHGRLPAEVDSDVLRVASVFATLERYLSWPVLQGALAVLARHDEIPLTAKHANGVISAAAGQDLSWLFEIASDRSRRVEYRLERFVSEPSTSLRCAAPCYHTRVVVTRLGNTAFSGSSLPRVGAFEAGAAVTLSVQFHDGQQLRERWDGRDETRQFEFQSSSPAAVVQLDPDGFLLLDSNRLDHRQVSEPSSNVPLGKWLVRWATWLQHAMLTYAMLV